MKLLLQWSPDWSPSTSRLADINSYFWHNRQNLCWVKVINLSRSLKFNYHSFKIHPLPLKKGSSIHGLKNLTWMIVVKCTKYMYCAIHHFFSLLDCWLLRDPYWSKTWCKIKLIVLSNFNYKSAALEPYALSRGYSF